MLSFLLPLALALPSHAGWVQSRRAAVEAYRQDILASLDEAQTYLEDLQEATLAPRRSDPRVELALVRLDVAVSYLDKGWTTVLAEVERDTAAPEGWRSWESRLAAAEKLVREKAPELAPALDRAKVRLGALSGLTLSQARGEGEVLFRGYFALNPFPPEALAGYLAHEATHADQAARAKAAGKTFKNDPASEAEARTAEAKVWLALGAPEALDFRGTMKANAEAYQAGPEAFKRFVQARFAEEPAWLWVESKPAAPVRPSVPKLGDLEAQARKAGAADAKALARQAREVASLRADVRKNLSTAVADRLKQARERLDQLVELAAPYPTVVNAPLLETNAVSDRVYPAAMWRFFQAVFPAAVELDRAREALGRKKLTPDEERELSRYLSSREETLKKPFEPAEAAAASAKLGRAAALRPALEKATVVLTRASDPAFEKNHPTWVFVPGARSWRENDARSAFAWTLRELALRAGWTELDAAELGLQALAAWPGEAGEPPLRWAAERMALDEGGRTLLKLYLDSRKD